MRDSNSALRIGVSLVALAWGTLSQLALAQSDSHEAKESEKIVVTGVLGANTIEDAPISISAVNEGEIAQQNPVSAADVLKNTYGPFPPSAPTSCFSSDEPGVRHCRN